MPASRWVPWAPGAAGGSLDAHVVDALRLRARGGAGVSPAPSGDPARSGVCRGQRQSVAVTGPLSPASAAVAGAAPGPTGARPNRRTGQECGPKTSACCSPFHENESAPRARCADYTLAAGSKCQGFALLLSPACERRRDLGWTGLAASSNLAITLDAFAPTSLSLLERACAKDQEAWGQLVHLYGPLVQRWCKRAELQDEDTADVFQETFQAVAHDLASFSPTRSTGSFRSWLRAIVRSKIVDHFRRRQRQAVGAGGTDAQMHLGAVADPLSTESEEEAAAEGALVAQRALQLIKPEFSLPNWTAFELVALEGKSAVEAAERLHLNPQAVRQANYRIRRRLRSVLQGLMDAQ
jgi:RNA polymerase sigma-70 factor (ECF subfamily)